MLGEVTANVRFAGEIQNMTIDGDPQGAKKLVFNGTETNEVKRLCVPGDRVFQLTDEFNFLVLEYSFINTSPNDEWLITLDTEFVNLENVNVWAAYFQGAGITDYTMIRDIYDDEYIKNLPVPTNGATYVYIKIEISDERFHSDFEANMIWTLNSRSYLYGRN